MTAPEQPRWRPDGWGAAVRVGVLVPDADVGPESELQAMAPPGVAVHAARAPFAAMAPGGGMDPTIPLAPALAFAEPPGIDDAARALAEAPLAAIGIGFTSAAYAGGPAGEAATVRRLAARTRGIPVASPPEATCVALRLLGAGRIAVISPPWFDQRLVDLGTAYFHEQGFGVVFAAPAALPSDQRAIEPGDLHAWAVAHVPDDAEAVVVGGNGFRAVGTIEALEASLGRPVLTANQVLLWRLLGLAGSSAGAGVSGYGRLFGRPAPGV